MLLKCHRGFHLGRIAGGLRHFKTDENKVLQCICSAVFHT